MFSRYCVSCISVTPGGQAGRGCGDGRNGNADQLCPGAGARDAESVIFGGPTRSRRIMMELTSTGAEWGKGSDGFGEGSRLRFMLLCYCGT